MARSMVERISALHRLHMTAFGAVRGKILHLYGTLFSNVPDYNGSQIRVDRIVVEG
jgi:hypothetical protein